MKWFHPALIAIAIFLFGVALTKVTNSPDYFYGIFLLLACGIEIVLISINKLDSFRDLHVK